MENPPKPPAERPGGAASPLVSVIMPAYNAERYLADSIRSVLAQTYADWELVVVDDGSTDGTARVARGFALADERVRYLYQENGGQGSARNTGLRNSRGTLVAFLDADDLWAADKLARQVAALEESGCDVVFSGGYIFSDDGAGDETAPFKTPRGKFGGAEMFDRLFAENFIPVLSVLARKQALADAGFFAEERQYQNCEDYELWLRLAERGALFFGMGERLVRYRRHAASMTHRQSKILLPMIAVLRRHQRPGGPRGAEEKERIRGLYRAAVSALLEEGRVDEARRCMREFTAWDSGALVTQLQSALLAVWPGGYNSISRECLYRAEWHAKSLRGRFSAPRPPAG